MQGGMKLQNNKYQVSKKHSYFSWWWALSRPKQVEIDKYTKTKLYTKLVLFIVYNIMTRSFDKNTPPYTPNVIVK